MKHFAITLCASALLVACSSSGGGNNENNRPNQTPNQQGQTLNNQNQKSTPNKQGQTPNVQGQNNQGPISGGHIPNNQGPISKAPEQTPNTPAPQNPNNQEQAPNNPAPNNPAPNNPAPNNPAPNNPAPQTPPARPNLPPKYVGDTVSKIGSSSWNAEKDKIVVYEIKTTKDFDDNISGARKFAPPKAITLTLADSLSNPGTKDYGFWALDEVGYYGFRRQTEADGSNKFNEYISAIKENLYATDVPTGLNARYQRDNGFIYGSALPQSEDQNSIYRQGNVNIVFTNGQASGSITENGNPVINITGNMSNLTFTTTAQASATIGANQKATMTPKFVNSSENVNDHRYITGVAKGEKWAGVLAAEKQ